MVFSSFDDDACDSAPQQHAAASQSSQSTSESHSSTQSSSRQEYWNESDWKADILPQVTSRFTGACSERFKKLHECSSEDECQKASVALSVCMASFVCNEHAVTFAKILRMAMPTKMSRTAWNGLNSSAQQFAKSNDGVHN